MKKNRTLESTSTFEIVFFADGGLLNYLFEFLYFPIDKKLYV